MQLSHGAFNDIRKVVHDLCGIVVSEDKQYLIKTRLESILKRNGLASYEALVQRLNQPASLALQDQVIEAITTKETSFNRDGHPFDELRRTILAALANLRLERKASPISLSSPIRIWCAAAATGQEAYSVAMAIADFLASRPGIALTLDDFSILASDISVNALATAREGRYSAAELGRGITLDQRERYFRQENGNWVVVPSLRRIIEFRRLNLVLPLPNLGTFDLILCRNLLIYFDDATRRRLCRTFHAALNPRGMLLIGAAESLYGVSEDFTTERLGSTVVHRKS
jgi:chemotaxis protein methyltransferase CheR